MCVCVCVCLSVCLSVCVCVPRRLLPPTPGGVNILSSLNAFLGRSHQTVNTKPLSDLFPVRVCLCSLCM